MTTISFTRTLLILLLLTVLLLLVDAIPSSSSSSSKKDQRYRQHKRLDIAPDPDSVAGRLTRTKGKSSEGVYAKMHSGGGGGGSDSSSSDDGKKNSGDEPRDYYVGPDPDEDVDWKRLEFRQNPETGKFKDIADLVAKKRGRGRSAPDAELRIEDLRECSPHQRFQDTRVHVFPNSEKDLNKTESKNWFVHQAVARRMDVNMQRAKLTRQRSKKFGDGPL